ncbi:hypothetical protein, partial [Vibrio anguillarum]|uniref:hypothetical protein n=1 Tax=Vibrio anguillarum TaxID=55601 RepID=UPI001BE425EF
AVLGRNITSRSSLRSTSLIDHLLPLVKSLGTKISKAVHFSFEINQTRFECRGGSGVLRAF